MKVLLLIPPKGFITWTEMKTGKANMYPLGIGYLGAVLEKEGIRVELLDCRLAGYSYNKLEKFLKELKPDIVGVSFTTENRFEAFETIRLAKKVIPSVIIIAGGPHPSLAAEDTLKHIPELDIIVRGEGEETILELVQTLEKNGKLDNVLGLSYRNGRKIIHNDSHPFIKNLDSLPFPKRVKLDEYNYTLNIPKKGVMKGINIITSRGCPFKCNFCATTKLWGHKWRLRSAENIVEEIEYLQNEYKINAFYFSDDAFTVDIERVQKFCDTVIDKKLDIYWFCDARVDQVNKKLLEKMKNAGCYAVYFGVESGSERIRNQVIHKHITSKQIKSIANWCNELGIEAHAFFIIGHPTETVQDVEATLRSTEELGVECSIAPLQIYPGTEIEQIAMQKEILPKNFTWTVEDKRVLAFKSLFGNAPLFIDTLNWEQISKVLYRGAKLKKYPIYKSMFKTLKTIRSLKQLKEYLIMGKVYIKTEFLEREHKNSETSWDKVYYSEGKRNKRLNVREKRIKFLNIEKNKKILEIGCGYGLNLAVFKKLGYNYIYALDISNFLLSKIENFELICADAYHIPCKPNSFDVIFISDALHHLLDTEKVLTEVGRVLKEEGELCFIEPRNSIIRRIFDCYTLSFLSNFSKKLKKRRNVLVKELHLPKKWFKIEDDLINVLKKSNFEIVFYKKGIGSIFVKCKHLKNRKLIPGGL